MIIPQLWNRCIQINWLRCLWGCPAFPPWGPWEWWVLMALHLYLGAQITGKWLKHKSCVVFMGLTLCDPMDYSTPGFPVLHRFPELAQTHVHWIGGAIQPSHLLLSPSHLAFNISQYQGLFQWVGSLYQVAKVLQLQLQHQSFQWIFRVGFL